MRKLYMFFVILILSVILVACDNQNSDDPIVTDDTFLFILEDLDGNKLINEEITYNKTSIFSSLDEQLELDYTEYDFGVMINGINGHYPTESTNEIMYFFSLYVNDELAMVGISEVEYQENLVITFKEEKYEIPSEELTFDFILVNLAGDTLVNEVIVYDNESIFTSLDEQLELDYTEYDFGVMINGINGHYPMESTDEFMYFYSLYVNDELEMVGISEVEYQENLVIKFVETSYEIPDEEIKTFTFSLVAINQEKVINEPVVYDNESILSSLEEVYYIDYDEYDFGIFINGIDDYYPFEYGITYNYYFGLYVDGEESFVGIDSVDYHDNLVLEFREVTFLSEEDQLIDQIIYNMETIFSVDKLDYSLVAALMQANNYGYNFFDLTDYSYEMNLNGVGNALKSVVANLVLQQLTTEEINALLEIEVSGIYNFFSYLHLLNVIDVDTEALSLEYARKVASTSGYLDVDAASSRILSTAGINDSDVLAHQEEMIEYLKTHVLEDGINSWGGANLSATAQTVLALLALGEDVVLEDVNLVYAMLAFHTETGFKNNLTGNVDLAFATPQGYAALIVYKVSRDQLSYLENSSLNIFDFSNYAEME